MNSKARFVPDAANQPRKASDGAITADTLISFGELKTPLGAIWNAEAAHGDVAIKIKAASMDATTGDETYTAQVISSAASNLGTPTVHMSKVLKAGINELLVSIADIVANAPSTHKYWGLNIDVAGTTPSVVLDVWVLPNSGKSV